MIRRSGIAVSLIVAALLRGGCRGRRSSSGGGQTSFEPRRRINPTGMVLPAGYRIEAVVTGLTFPVTSVFNDANRLYAMEAGCSYGEVYATLRLLRALRRGGGPRTVAAGG